MYTQYIELGNRGWHVIVYYNVSSQDFQELAEVLYRYDCPIKTIQEAASVLKRRNTGFTFTNYRYKTSVVCIGQATKASQFLNTTIHEAKHVQSHICDYYGVKEDSEEAAYLIGYMVSRMYKALIKTLKLHV